MGKFIILLLFLMVFSSCKEKKIEFENTLNIPRNNDIKVLEKLKFIIENYDEEDVIETRKILKMIIKEIRVISFYPLKISILFY